MAKDIKKDVKLIGREFGSIRQNLVDFTKTYFPQTFNDFNESSPGMMMLELSSYVGDVLSYYALTQLAASCLSCPAGTYQSLGSHTCRVLPPSSAYLCCAPGSHRQGVLAEAQQ